SEVEIEKMREVITAKIAECSTYFTKQAEIFGKLMANNGVSAEAIRVDYTHPRQVRIQVTSPPAMAFVRLLERLDELAMQIDLLWWGGVFNDRQRLKALHQLQGHLIKTGQ
ncbi:MAG: DUF1845 family protein, partial [Alphaproteobacteria bacterium]|nr:DUF1845 family protein [Alphaproteobacteria bacterium]